MLKNKKIAVIGAGHMGGALIAGLVRSRLASPKSISASRRDPAALEELRRQWGVHAMADNRKAVSGAHIVLLAVKPQMGLAVLEELAPALDESQLVISLMAGITTAAIQAKLKAPCPVVRAMPNTPASIGAGATAVAAGSHAGEKELALAEHIFGSVGAVARLPEAALDAVTGLSGTGPVYIFMLIEAMIDGGVKMGLPRATARALAVQTVFGAAKLVMESGKHPAILKDDVTTPGGTAIHAIHSLEASGLRSLIIDAIAAATQRSQELSRLYAK